MNDRIRVVLVDDSRAVLLVTRWLLEEDGRFTVAADVDDPTRAVDASREADLVVLDIAMPGIDGLTLLQEIRTRHPHVSLVMLSAHVQPYLRDEAFRRGAVDFIDKAAPPNEIVDRLAAAAGRDGDGGEPTLATP